MTSSVRIFACLAALSLSLTAGGGAGLTAEALDANAAVAVAERAWQASAASEGARDAWDAAVRALRAGTYVDGPAGSTVSGGPTVGQNSVWNLQVHGTHGHLAFEGKVTLTVAKTAVQTQLKRAVESGTLEARVSFRLFPLGDFGGRYREVARRVEFGVESKAGFVPLAEAPVLFIQDFDAGARDRATVAKLFDEVFVEGGHQMPELTSSDLHSYQSLKKGPASFSTPSTLVTEDLFLQVMGSNPSSDSKDRNAPWRAVTDVTWAESAEFCYRLSLLQGLKPSFVPGDREWTIDATADGWRMPTNDEALYAALGGAKARPRALVAGDGPDYLGVLKLSLGPLPGEADSPRAAAASLPPNDLGITGFTDFLETWLMADTWTGYKSTFAAAGATVSGNFQLGLNLRGRFFGLRIVRKGGAAKTERSTPPVPAAFSQPSPSPSLPAIPVLEVKGGTFRKHFPNRDVVVSDFAMAKFPVTQELYQLVTGENPSAGKGADSPRRPVESVSFVEAAKFSNRLSALSGLHPVYRFVTVENNGYNRSIAGSHQTLMVFQDLNEDGWRLPTEAEFEYAARGGSLSKGYHYAGGNKADDVAWTATNSGGRTHPVGTKAPNELGLYDLSGNVSQWCWDAGPLVPFVPLVDPAGLGTGVAMGGSYLHAGWNSPLQVGVISEDSSLPVGIRLVRRTHATAPQPPFDALAPLPPADLNQLLKAYRDAGSERAAIDGPLYDLAAASWVTDASQVKVTSITSPHPDEGERVFGFESTDKILKWRGSHTFYRVGGDVDGLFKAGQLRARITWRLVPFLANQFAVQITNIEPGAVEKNGTWRPLPLFAEKPDAFRGEIGFLPVLAGTFDPRKGAILTDSIKPPEVSVPSGDLPGFLMTQFPITNGQYLALEGTLPALGHHSSGSSWLQPVDRVAYSEAARFANDLSIKMGLEPVYSGRLLADADTTKSGWRLPTVAEYEWARKGATKSRGYATWAGTNTAAEAFFDPAEAELSPWPVGLKVANELGLYDMTGNVQIWVGDLSDYDKKWMTRHTVGRAWNDKAGFLLTTSPSPGFQDGRDVVEAGIRLVRNDPTAAPAEALGQAETGKPWVVTSKGAIFSWDGSSWIPRAPEGSARKITMGPTGQVWPGGAPGASDSGAIDMAWGARGTSLWRIALPAGSGGYSIQHRAGDGWETVDGAAVHVAVDDRGAPWVVNDAGRIYRRVGSDPVNGSWQQVAGSAKEIAIGSQGDVWIIDTDARVKRWDGTTWIAMGFTASSIAVR